MRHECAQHALEVAMFGRLLPKETSFYDFFEEHARLTVQGTAEFVSLVSSAANIEAKAKRIKEIEHETDVITHRCVGALHTVFITPIERDDIYHLITKMDDIMDYVEAGAERISLYDISEMTPEVVDMADTLWRASKEVEEALNGLRDLKNPKHVLAKCVDINRLENEADAILRRALARMFREEKDPIKIIKWKEIYEHVESATDSCEDVANIIEGVVLDNA
jgi:predicted phosphate transport protein (TIGR00153 family)